MMDYLQGSDQAGLYPTYEANKGCSGNEVWKNHGIVMYDSIYDRDYYGRRSYCYSCTNSNNCNCN